MYQDLASFYDNGFRDRFSKVVTTKVIDALDSLGLGAPGKLLDLGSGTGRVAIALAEAGFEVIGIDRSERMLDIAKRRLEVTGGTVDLRVGDIRSFAFPDPFDAVVATGDMVNHLLSDADVAAMFQCAFDAVLPGGALIFDVNTDSAYRGPLWNLEEHTVETDGYTMTTSARYSPDTGIGRVDVRVIERTMMTEYDRRGSVRERFYSDESLARLLRGVGWEVVSAETFHPIDASAAYPFLDGAKALWVCRRG